MKIATKYLKNCVDANGISAPRLRSGECDLLNQIHTQIVATTARCVAHIPSREALACAKKIHLAFAAVSAMLKRTAAHSTNAASNGSSAHFDLRPAQGCHGFRPGAECSGTRRRDAACVEVACGRRRRCVRQVAQITTDLAAASGRQAMVRPPAADRERERAGDAISAHRERSRHAMDRPPGLRSIFRRPALRPARRSARLPARRPR